MTSHFARFSQEARRTLALAQEEAQRHGVRFISPEHILLGLIRARDGQALRVLEDVPGGADQLRMNILKAVTRGQGGVRNVELTPGAKRVLETAVKEARQLGHDLITTGHLLLGVLVEQESAAARLLAEGGLRLEEVRPLLTGEESAEAARRQAAARVAGLYVIVDPQFTNGRDVVEVARAALRGGALAIQLRDKAHDKGDQLPVARRLRALCDQLGASFIVNDHADLAVAANAHGLHVGQHDLPVPEARRILRSHQFIGTSNALLEEAQVSLEQKADYIAVGAMYGSTSKEGTRPAGVEALRRVRRLVKDVPIVAIGGINLANVGPVLEAGADGICVISAVGMAEDPEAAARALAERIRGYKAGASKDTAPS